MAPVVDMGKNVDMNLQLLLLVGYLMVVALILRWWTR